ncbi:MAG: hypothetical protein AAGE61_03365 [Pseudomonadota bacterium]
MRVPFGSQAVGDHRTAERLTAAAASSRGACYTSLRAPAFLWTWFFFLNRVLVRRFGARCRVPHAAKAGFPATASVLSPTPVESPYETPACPVLEPDGNREPVRHKVPGNTAPRSLLHASREDLEHIIDTLPHTAPRFLHAAGLLKAKYKVRVYG